MKTKPLKLKYQIFLYMSVSLFIWFVICNIVSEWLYWLEDEKGVEFPLKFYIFINAVQLLLLIFMNIPFMHFLIKHIDRPVQKIISSLNRIADGNYNEKINFESKNEFDEIKDAFNSMSEQLETAQKIKENAENERILLFANMAHDLKTPITSILGYSKALSDRIITDEQKKSEYLATINSKASKMNELIDRLFEYVKLDSTENLLHKENCDIAEILRNCLADVYTEYEEQKIHLEIEIPDSPVIKNVDKVELSRVYTNLLNNVLKHNTPNIRALVKMNEDGTVLIADSGEAFPKTVADSLFMPFVCGDQSRQSKNGSGLGLALAYKIMKKHGGDLRLLTELPGYTKGFSVELKN